MGHLVKELALELVKSGDSVSVIAGGSGRDGDSGGQTSPVGVRHVGWLAFSRKSHFRRALSYLSLYPAMLWAGLWAPRPDVMVTTTDPPLQAVLGVFLQWRHGCKLVHWCQDLYPELAEEGGVLRKGGWFAGMLRAVSTAALLRHDRVVSIGRCMTLRLIGRGVAPEHIRQISNWTNAEAIVPMEQAESEFGRREGLQARFLAVYSGNLGMAHSFEEILGAAEILERSAPDALFVFIGDGPRRKEVERGVQDRGLGNVRFFAAQAWQDLSDSMAAGHVHLVSLRSAMSGLVVPSKFYGMLAAGRPCVFIGPADSEVARCIAEEGVGRVVCTAASLADALLAYRADPKGRAAEGVKARRLGREASCERAAAEFRRQFLELTGVEPAGQGS